MNSIFKGHSTLATLSIDDWRLFKAKYGVRNRDTALIRDFDTAIESRVAKTQCSIDVVPKSPIADAKSS